MQAISKNILKYQPLLWLTGLVIPFYYLLFALNLPKVIRHLKNPVVLLFILFVICQIISTLLAISSDFFTMERFFGIVHNISASCFFLLGFLLPFYKAYRRVLFTAAKYVFLFVALGCVAVFVYSFLTKTYVAYPGVMALISGARNDLTMVSFNQEGWLLGIPFPRSRIMGTFPNSTSILLILVYTIFVVQRKPKYAKKLFFALLFFAAIITTGSRGGSLVAIMIVATQFVRHKLFLYSILIASPLVFLAFGALGTQLFESRAASNDTRLELYMASLELAWRTNFLFGLGLKPFVDTIASGELPVGSHSTLIGYFIKNGVVGGLLALFFYVKLVTKAVQMIVTTFLNKRGPDGVRLELSMGVLAVITVSFFDDLDAYELLPFYFGIMVNFLYNPNAVSKA